MIEQRKEQSRAYENYKNVQKPITNHILRNLHMGALCIRTVTVIILDTF